MLGRNWSLLGFTLSVGGGKGWAFAVPQDCICHCNAVSKWRAATHIQTEDYHVRCNR
jgi:hypothetical protein